MTNGSVTTISGQRASLLCLAITIGMVRIAASTRSGDTMRGENLIAISDVGSELSPRGAWQTLLDLDSAAQRNPARAENWMRLGHAYLLLGIHDEALRFLQRAHRADSLSFEANLGLARLFRETGNFKRAEAHYKVCLSVGSPFAEALAFIGDLALSQGQRDSARHYYRRVLAVQPEHENVLVNLAVMATHEGDTAEAVLLLEKCLVYHPESWETRLNLGIVYTNQGRFHDALKQFGRLSKRDPDEPGLCKAVGILLFRNGLSEEAASFLRTALTRRPRDVEARLALAFCHVTSEDTAAAEKLLAEGLREAGNPTIRYNFLAMLAELHLRQGDIADASRYAQQAIQVDSTRASAYALLGATMRASGEEEKARRALEQARERQLKVGAMIEPYLNEEVLDSAAGTKLP